MLKKWIKKISITKKITLTFTIAIVILFSINTIIIYKNSFDTTLSYSEKNLTGIANNNTEAANKVIDNFNYAVDIVINDTELNSYINLEKYGDYNDLYEFSRSNQKFTQYIKYAQTSFLVPTTGVIILTDDKLYAYSLSNKMKKDENEKLIMNDKYGIYNDSNVRNNELIKKVSNNNEFSTRMVLSNDRNYIYFYKTIYNSTSFERYGQQLGVIVSGFSVSSFEDVIGVNKLTKGTKIVLLNNNRDIVYSSDKTLYENNAELNFDTGKEHYKTRFKGKESFFIMHKLHNDYYIATIIPLSDIYNEINNSIKLIIPFSFVIILLGIIIIIYVSRVVVNPIKMFAKKIQNIKEYRNINIFISDKEADEIVNSSPEIEVLWSSFSDLLEQINKYVNDLQMSNEKQRIAEIKALQSEINPHFLYNTLDTVCCVALLKGETEIVDLLSRLASIMRYNIKNPEILVTVSDEIEHIKNYVEIQKARSIDQFKVEYNIELETLKCKIPKLIIQPLIENSLIHGIFSKNGEGVVLLESLIEGNSLVINVIDNGTCGNIQEINKYLNDDSYEMSAKHGFGIRNVNNRIKFKFGEEYGLVFENMPNGNTKARIILPIQFSES